MPSASPGGDAFLPSSTSPSSLDLFDPPPGVDGIITRHGAGGGAQGIYETKTAPVHLTPHNDGAEGSDKKTNIFFPLPPPPPPPPPADGNHPPLPTRTALYGGTKKGNGIGVDDDRGVRRQRKSVHAFPMTRKNSDGAKTADSGNNNDNNTSNNNNGSAPTLMNRFFHHTHFHNHARSHNYHHHHPQAKQVTTERTEDTAKTTTTSTATSYATLECTRKEKITALSLLPKSFERLRCRRALSSPRNLESSAGEDSSKEGVPAGNHARPETNSTSHRDDEADDARHHDISSSSSITTTTNGESHASRKSTTCQHRNSTTVSLHTSGKPLGSLQSA